MIRNSCGAFALYMNGKAGVACVRIYFLFFILGVLCVVFLYKKNFLTWIAALINRFAFKKLILQFFDHCCIISFIKFVAMILLQILKSIKNVLVLIIILLSVKKVISNTIRNFISNNVKGIRASQKRLKIF